MKKKIISSLLVIVGLFIITGCSSNGKWDISLTSKEYADSYCKVLYSTFLTSSTTYTKNDDTFICDQETSDKDEFLLFEITGKYTGSSVYSDYIENFKLVYGKDYTISPASVYISIGNGEWTYIDGESINHHSIKIDPLETTEFTIRGAFEINAKIETDTEQSLVLKTPFGKEFNLR
jgi:hypothetical protein